MRSRMLRVIALVAILGGGLCGASHAQAAADPSQAEIIALVCDPGDIDTDGECKNAKNYPDPSRDTCTIGVGGYRGGRFRAGHNILLVDYRSNCEPHATEFGGSLVLDNTAGQLRFLDYAPGFRWDDCVTFDQDGRDRLFCLGSHTRGSTSSKLVEVLFGGDRGDHIRLTEKPILSGLDTRGDYGAQVVTCSDKFAWVWLSGTLKLGKTPGTLVVEGVEYLDTPTVKAACAGKLPPKEVAFGHPGKGEVFMAPKAVPTGDLTYNIRTGKWRLQPQKPKRS